MNSGDTRDTNSGAAVDSEHSNVELVRVIDRTIHVSEVDRRKETDHTMRNNSDEEVNYVFLPLREFKVNLEVHDEDGRRLNYFPNSEVEEMVDDLQDRDADVYERMKHWLEREKYQLFVQLPPERPLDPGELRTITLTFEQSETVDFHGLSEPSVLRGWRENWERKFFEIPSFLANAERYPGRSHDEFAVVIGPTGYTTTGSVEHDAKDTDGQFYENGGDDDTRVFSARLPPALGEPYTWDLQYDLVPDNRNLMRALVLYWVTVVFVGLVSIVVATLGWVGWTGAEARTLSGAIVTGTIGIVFALDADWADRYRLLSVVPILLHGLAWFLWTVSISGGS